MFVGSGESPLALYNAIGTNSAAEDLFLTSDSYIYFEAACQTIGSR